MIKPDDFLKTMTPANKEMARLRGEELRIKRKMVYGNKQITASFSPALLAQAPLLALVQGNLI